MVNLEIIWDRMPLNKKFTTLIIGILTIPVIIILFFLFNNMADDEKQKMIENANNSLQKINDFAISNESMASSIIQLIHTNPQLTQSLKSNLSTLEIVNFNTTVTPYFENIIITNPYIKNLRIYTNIEAMPERYPIFINNDRVRDDDWFINAKSNILQARIGYDENLSEHISQLSNNSLISYYQALEIYEDDKTVIEVSFEMKEFFGDVYTTTQNGVCLIKSENEIFIHDFENMTDEYKEILKNLVLSVSDENFDNTTKSINGHDYLINHKNSKSLGISYYIVNDLTTAFVTIRHDQFFVVTAILLLFVVLAFIMQIISNVLLKRIYETISAMRQLETGNTLIQIENPSNDEIGELQKYFNKMVVRIDELIDQAAKRAILEKNAEINALQNQINSHFLYNVLNNIEMMAIIEENFLIADTVTALARLLRYSMNWSKQLVCLSSELDYVKDYIDLFNMRFDNTISLICDIKDEATSALIPKMSVQPVVENAIIHGIENLTSDEIIRIAVKIEDNILTIGITDTGCGMTEQELAKLRTRLENSIDYETTGNGGIGLTNVSERIKKSFGFEYGIDVYSNVNEYTKVELRLPFIHENDTDIML